MTLFLVLAVLLPWSLWRQMHAHPVSRESLVKLPLIFAAVGALTIGHHALPATAAAAADVAFSLALSIGFGIWRGAVMPVWRDADGRWTTKGNAETISLWVAMIAIKFLLGAIGSVTGWFPSTSAGEVFLFLAISFAVQNLVIARRTTGRSREAVPALS